MRGRRSQVVSVSADQRTQLEQLSRSRSVTAGLQKRPRAVVDMADGSTFRQA